MEGLEYDSYFKKIFKQYTKGVEEHTFHHFNSSMGIQIYGKAHYYHEMKKRRMVPYEETERLAEEWDKKHPPKEYDTISPKSMDIIKSLKMTADKNGNIKLGDRAITAMVEIGVIKTRSEHIPGQYQRTGGFNA